MEWIKELMMLIVGCTINIFNIHLDYHLTIGLVEENLTISMEWFTSIVEISHSPITPEQIKKIYEDEKQLPRECKGNLYGSSDAVTALAYDDSTNLFMRREHQQDAVNSRDYAE